MILRTGAMKSRSIALFSKIYIIKYVSYSPPVTSSPMQPINTPTYLRLREQIRTDIVAGVWPLGSHVTLAKLSDHYQVSNVPVREALLQLQGEGIIEMRMHKGAVIPAIDERYVDNVYRLRGAIQTMLARDAAERANPQQLQQLACLAQAHEDAVAGGDAKACVDANRDFHVHVDSIAGNTIALEILASRNSLVDAYRRAKGWGPGRLDAAIAQHRKLVRAITKRDGEAAARAAHDHTDSSRKDLLALVRQHSPA